MIFGIGTDILKVSRIEAALGRHGDRFASRILGPQEMEKYLRRKQKVEARGLRFLATRFAAKEAFSKAIGLGMRMPMTWRLCEVGRQPSGQPTIVLHGVLHTWCTQRRLRAHVSLSDESDYATSYVIVEQSPP